MKFGETKTKPSEKPGKLVGKYPLKKFCRTLVKVPVILLESFHGTPLRKIPQRIWRILLESPENSPQQPLEGIPGSIPAEIPLKTATGIAGEALLEIPGTTGRNFGGNLWRSPE